MAEVAVVGCGVVGAAIAYELGCVPGLRVTVFDRQPPAQASTGAALGVLMGAISHKVKGNAWALRETSLRRYETLIPALEKQLGRTLPYNRHGIVLLCFEADLTRWDALIETRQAQGWQLERWTAPQLQAACPQIQHSGITAAIYSPQDRQIDPTALTLALVAAAQQNGVQFEFDRSVLGLETGDAPSLHTDRGRFRADWVVVAAGLGAAGLTQAIDLRPVLGQALRVRLPLSLGKPEFQPVITGEDIHLVPLAGGDYWVGATVELPDEDGTAAAADPDRLRAVLQGAIDFCPALAGAEVVQTWSGLRPRPQGRPAPIIEPLAGQPRVLLATGHYRNGVLLAPATALRVRAAIEPFLK